MDIDLAQKAISLALTGKWKEAIDFNKKILEEDPEDIDSLNRLAKAYSEVGKFDKAITTSKKVLRIDPYNKIAQKSLERWKNSDIDEDYKPGKPSPQAFLEEPGKTKMISLINLGDPKVLANLDPGHEVQLVCHTHKVSIITPSGKYIGRLPDDLAARLKRFIKYNNTYQVLIKSSSIDEVKVFIREISRGKEVKDVASFPTEKINYVAFTPPDFVHKERPETTPLEHEELI